MINLMLNHLRYPACILGALSGKVLIQILHFNLTVPGCFSYSAQGKTSLFCNKWILSAYDYRINHCKLKKAGINCNNTFLFSNHIRCHSCAILQMGAQCV